MKRRILGYRAPPRHRRTVIAHTWSAAALQHFQTNNKECVALLGGGGVPWDREVTSWSARTKKVQLYGDFPLAL